MMLIKKRKIEKTLMREKDRRTNDIKKREKYQGTNGG